MKYRVVLHKQNETLCPYILDIEASTEQKAIVQAKETIAKIAYWGCLELKPLEERINRLVIDNVIMA